jgi:hypothetical protein
LRSEAHTAPTAPSVLQSRNKDWQRRGKKILNQLPMVESTFFIVFHFSLVKAMVNAQRLCKLHKDALNGIGNGAQLSKAELGPLRTCQLWRVEFPKFR